MSKRRQVREKVLQALYAFELSQQPLESLYENILTGLSRDRELQKFARQLVKKVIETHEELDKYIRAKVTNWEFNRLAVIDKLILRMCICELLYFDDIPPKVSINEAIEIARRYSTDKSDKFVNGVLDSVLADLRASGTMKKSGRGLVDTSPQKRTGKSKPDTDAPAKTGSVS
jgi:N utilization substance protein B